MSLVIGTLVNTGLIVLDLSVYLIYIVPSLICMDSEDVTGVDGVHIVLVVGIDLRVVDKTGGLIDSVVGMRICRMFTTSRLKKRRVKPLRSG